MPKNYQDSKVNHILTKQTFARLKFVYLFWGKMKKHVILCPLLSCCVSAPLTVLSPGVCVPCVLNFAVQQTV